MNSLTRSISQFRLVRFLDRNWLLNVVLIKANPGEVVSEETVIQIIERHLSQIEDSFMSDEFEYFRTGFAFLHYGNRGVDLTVWHAGKWGRTYEVFSVSWYCYDRDIQLMQVLDHAEPVICQYEMLLMCEHLNSLSEIIKNLKSDDVFQDVFHQWYLRK